MRARLRAAVPFLAFGALGWLFDWVRLRDPVPVAVEGGFYAGSVDVHPLGFPVGVSATDLWPGTLLGLRPVYLLEVAGLYLALHAAAAVAAGLAFSALLPGVERPTAAVYARLFAVALFASLLVGPVLAVASIEFLLLVGYGLVLAFGVLPTLLFVGPALVAERTGLRGAWASAERHLRGQYGRTLVGLLVVGVLADALVSVPVAGGFLGTAAGGFAYAVFAAGSYRE